MTADFAIFAIALTFLVISGRLVIKYLSEAAEAFNVSRFATAFVLLAIATSIPELSVAIASAQQGAGDLVIAIVLGSNVVNATLVIGIAAFFSLGISAHNIKLRSDLLMSASLTILPLVFLTNGIISRLEGAILSVAFLFHLFLLYHNRSGVSENPVKLQPQKGARAVAMTLILIVVLIISADQTINSAVGVANDLGIPAILIGIMLIALGTSLPELTTAIHAARARESEFALGNVLGSNVTNSTLVIGLASFLYPISVPLNPTILVAALFVIISTTTLVAFAASRRNISVKESIVFLSIFLLFGVATLFASLT